MWTAEDTTEVWVRNPNACVRECVEVGMRRIVWDRGMLVKCKIDPAPYMETFFPGQPWECLIIDTYEAVLITPHTTEASPAAVYPVWEYGRDSLADLSDWLESPVGENRALCNDKSIKQSLRPVYGQANKVIITQCPDVRSGPGKAVFRELAAVQEEHPDGALHVHGIFSWRVMFGLAFASVDVEPRETARKGNVFLPSGKLCKFEHSVDYVEWVRLLGYLPVDLKIPRNRCMYNIKSAVWAGANFRKNTKFRTRGFDQVDPDDPLKNTKSKTIMIKRAMAVEGDHFYCDTCSLQLSCKFFRDGSVCSVPGSEGSELQKMFNSRDADKIIDGLGSLLAVEAERIEDALETEKADGELNPETTKMIDKVFTHGIKLAKLIKPSLGQPTVQNNTFLTNVQGMTPQALAAACIQELEARGFKREEITPEMIDGLLTMSPDDRMKAITTAVEGRVVE